MISMTDFPATNRSQALSQWVASQLGLTSAQLTPIASDAGFRRYFRFASPSQWLAVDAPPATEDSRQFVALARYLSQHGVTTPRILAADEAQGFLLVEDFGDALLYNQINAHNADELYRRALTALQRIQSCPDQPDLIPRYDQPLLRRELLIFKEWFVEQLLGFQPTQSEIHMLEACFDLLESSALSQPQTLVHRDFHSRNLILRSDSSEVGVIDFQGALWGACTYDLVSLLRDCYLCWPIDKVNEWMTNYHQTAVNSGLLPQVSLAEFRLWFDWMGLQRHIKVLGIFARLHLRDRKPHYLHDLPLVIRYTLEVSGTYDQLKPFNDWFVGRLLPLIQQQPWYKAEAEQP